MRDRWSFGLVIIGDNGSKPAPRSKTYSVIAPVGAMRPTSTAVSSSAETLTALGAEL
jgi:hypothetical protein